MVERIAIWLDKVEILKVEQLKKLPEYSELDTKDIVHRELKERLFERARKLEDGTWGMCIPNEHEFGFKSIYSLEHIFQNYPLI